MKTTVAQAKATTNSPCEIKNWIPPNSGTYKVNVDAALDLERGKFGAGIVIRDHSGRILKAAALVVEGRVSIDIAEAKAVYEGLMLAKQSGLLPLSIESDSLTVVKLCNGEISTRSDVFNVISDIQIVVNREERILISHIPRICNRVAHEIARAIGLDISVFFDAPFPPWLQMVALSDNIDAKSTTAGGRWLIDDNRRRWLIDDEQQANDEQQEMAETGRGVVVWLLSGELKK
ncbi:hypothetical protein LWI29_003986 [Acer saccharum]|uniref:RNase H type-1 domain-containing protein n=1 Tax=Acer saccharum TaxID=4024 RepID=A0AA39S2F4_ACESA|nr:hypothetical protein LWI29_003986 [Acer saccharum]